MQSGGDAQLGLGPQHELRPLLDGYPLLHPIVLQQAAQCRGRQCRRATEARLAGDGGGIGQRKRGGRQERDAAGLAVLPEHRTRGHENADAAPEAVTLHVARQRAQALKLGGVTLWVGHNAEAGRGGERDLRGRACRGVGGGGQCGAARRQVKNLDSPPQSSSPGSGTGTPPRTRRWGCPAAQSERTHGRKSGRHPPSPPPGWLQHVLPRPHKLRPPGVPGASGTGTEMPPRRHLLWRPARTGVSIARGVTSGQVRPRHEQSGGGVGWWGGENSGRSG